MARKKTSEEVISNIDPERAIGLAKEDGGFTLNPRTGEKLDSGVMVSLGGMEQRHSLASVNHLDFANYVNSPGHLDALTRRGRHMGGWVSSMGTTKLNEEPRIQRDLVMDVSRRFNPTPEGRTSARREAVANNQEAIFDLGSFNAEVNPLHPKNLAAGHELVPGTAEHYMNNPGPVGEAYFAEVTDPSKIGGKKKTKPQKGQQSLVF
jgi:hypothetical protein